MIRWADHADALTSGFVECTVGRHGSQSVGASLRGAGWAASPLLPALAGEKSMRLLKQDSPFHHFKLWSSTERDVEFDGWRLALVEKLRPAVLDHPGISDGSKRKAERAIYLTKGGNIVCHKLDRSQARGECDRGEVLVIRRPEPSRVDTVTGAFGGTEFFEIDFTVPENWAAGAVAEFFRGDSLAKDLLEEVGIADVEKID